MVAGRSVVVICPAPSLLHRAASALPVHIGERTSAIAGHGSPRPAPAPEVELFAGRIQLSTKLSET
ncbi:hypothetical protein I545_5542 [Mycobacterium kansasii 662]|uniref:Uncharacterized protein n=2 Tax=Mycobacterium kansasii TaxID=1768 RepID=A0A1V3XF38_MYCKA|nr:hypothetical protein I545_5542 [Mycobacterium kansasii 662]OOK66407.1 hypothetical protein BZL30_8217 [Mycobacterium kansasii]OOK77718.1 hypothetical protein BZL29_3259 [Mycobacterium kansasii]